MLRPAACLLVLTALGLTACDDDAGPPKPVVAASRQERAQQIAEDKVRARYPGHPGLRLRAIQVYRQQQSGSFAVCGQVNPTGEAVAGYIPWVATIDLRPLLEASGNTLVVGASNTEASRVYIESVDRCFDGGGPNAGRRKSSHALPMTPADAELGAGKSRHDTPPSAEDDSQPDPPPPAATPGLGVAALRSVVTTASHPTNLRSQPGGGVLRTVPRSSRLQVFAEAPGGWLQVGEDQPAGWVHSSMVERR